MGNNNSNGGGDNYGTCQRRCDDEFDKKEAWDKCNKKCEEGYKFSNNINRRGNPPSRINNNGRREGSNRCK